jgi:magnesium chelatase family protein
LLDRIDLHVEVPRLPPAELRLSSSSESSATVRSRVIEARAHQHARAGKPNALLGQSEMTSTCRLRDSDQTLLERAIDTLQLSARSMHRILRVARTIADLADSPDIQTMHLTEAIGYRRMEGGLEPSTPR